MTKKVHVSFITRTGEAVAFDADAEQAERRRRGKRKLSEYNRFVRNFISSEPSPTNLDEGRTQLTQAAEAWNQRPGPRKRQTLLAQSKKNRS